MNIFYPIHPDLKIQKIQISETEEEYCGYLIEIHTDEGVINITGCHDMGPDLEKTELLKQDEDK